MAQSLETLRSKILTSIYGRRLGFDSDAYLVGPKDLKLAVQDITTTSPTTATAYGITHIATLSSTQGPVQHELPAPVPGVEKTITMAGTSTASQQFLTTPAGAAVLISSLGTTGNCVNFRGPGGFIKLVGLSTALWGVAAEALYSSTALAKTVLFTTSTA